MKKKLEVDHYLSDLFRHINAPIVVWNQEHEIISFNEVFARMSGYSESEIIGQSLDALFSEDDRFDFLQTIEDASCGECSVEIPIWHKDGEVRVVLWNSSPIYDGKTQIATIASGQDITERKKLETQLSHAQKMEAIGVLAGGIAHDFNNVLQGISGYTQLLLMKKTKGDPDRDYLKQIDRLVQGSSKLIEQLLLFGRKVEIKLGPVDLNQEVLRSIKLLKKLIPKMISIETHLSDDLKLVNVDTAQLEQVMMNLVVNASDAMPDGGRLVIESKNTVLDQEYCNVHLGSAPGRYVLLTVSDTGCGMGKEALEHIFEPFYTTKEVGKGTGLGLAIVYGIMKSFKGYITCYSQPGQETVFSVYFPALEVVEDVESLAAEHEKAGRARGGNETILLVDDEKSVLDVACDILSQYGYTTITAKSGGEAVEIYETKRNRIDLVILDIGMPGMGGHKCLKKLLGINPEIKVIIASGYPAIGKVKETTETGATGFIGKPYRLIDLVEKVREALDFN